MKPGDHPLQEPTNDPFDEMLRQALHHNTPPSQPPAHVWERIQGQVTAGPAPTSHRPPAERLSRLLAPFVQGLAAAVLFVLVGMSLATPHLGGARPLGVAGPAAVPIVAEAYPAPPEPASVQRLGRYAAADDADDYGLSQSQASKRAVQAERMARLSRANDDLDGDLVQNERFALLASGQ